MTDATRDDDFYLWTRQQAAALRAHARSARDNLIDWPGVIEEVEDMGKSERIASMSLLVQILCHAYKIEHSRNREPVRKWRAEIAAFQDQVAQHMTPTLRREADEAIGEIHARACRLLHGQFAAYDEPNPDLPAEPPYSVAELLDPGFNLRPQPKAPGV